MRWNIGYFGVKDLFTIVNLLGGCLGIHYAMEGNLEYAAYAAFGGFIFGDALDGPVARLTNTGNKFGSEFDRVVDHMSQTVTPAVVLYKAYALRGAAITGVVMMTLLLTAASIRHARGSTADFKWPTGFFGLNRTGSGLVALALPNAEIFFRSHPWWYELGIAVTVIVCALNLAPVPFLSHRPKVDGKRRPLQWYVVLVAWVFLLGWIPIALFARAYVWDFIFVITFGYAFTAWIPVRTDERKAFYAEYKRWSAEVAAAK